MSEEPTNTEQEKADWFFEIRPLRTQDIHQVAVLHTLVFPDYFLTHMGRPFLKRFYSQFLEAPSVAIGAFTSEQCVGFAAGTSQLEQLRRRFYRKNFLLIVLITVQRFLLDSFIRKEINKRIGHVRLAVKAVLERNDRSFTKSSLPTESPPFQARSGDLVGIGVHPSWQGKGIADELVRQFGIALSKKGIKAMSLTVRSNNVRAIRFYEKTGWQVSSTKVDYIHFRRSTDFS